MTFIISGVLGAFPLTREHCNTKCVSCDGQVDIGKSVFKVHNWIPLIFGGFNSIISILSFIHQLLIIQNYRKHREEYNGTNT